MLDRKFVTKGLRLDKVKSVTIKLRPEVYSWLAEQSALLKCASVVLVRGIIEDAYDSYKSKEDPEDDSTGC